MTDTRKEEEPFVIKIVDVVEHEDGSAIYKFDLDKQTTTHMANLGLEFVLYCAAYGVDIQDALNGIKKVNNRATLAVNQQAQPVRKDKA